MSLQARLRHALGERWVELPERGVDQPVVVGRAAAADLQVPSVTVGQKHCVLFVHEGRWVVQEVGGTPGTYVNGTKVAGAAFLSVGDVITLGPDGAAPAIEIDPAGAAEGRAGQPAAGAVAPAVAHAPAAAPHEFAFAPAAPQYPGAYAPPQPTVAPGYAPAYPPYAATTYPVPAAAQWQQPAAPVPAATQEGSIADWPTDATPRYYPSRRRRTSGGGSGVIIGMMLTLLITAGAGYWIYRHFGNRNPLVVVPAPSTQASPAAPATRRAADDPAGAPPSIFDPTQPRRATTRATTRTATGGAPATAPPGPDMAAVPPEASPQDPPEMANGDAGAGDGAASQDPSDAVSVAGDDPAWKQVEAARHLKDEAKAILQFDDYARTHPGAAADQIQQYTDAMLDRIWFERIENLCEQREELNRKIAEVDKDLAEETDANHKTRVLNPLRQQYVSRVQNIEEELATNMKYTEKSTPNLLDDAEIERLRQARDPQYFASWKNRVLAHVRRTHGELPWVATKSR